MSDSGTTNAHNPASADGQGAIRIDPATGQKRFYTRAAKASDKIAGKGYSVQTNAALKTLPEAPPGAVFDAKEQARYRAFKEARAGAADYMAMEGEFSKYLEDVYSAEPVPRPALTDECEILVVGAGFAGLLLWHKLQAAGFTCPHCQYDLTGAVIGGTKSFNKAESRKERVVNRCLSHRGYKVLG